MPVDLHLHTIHSDGNWTPSEVVQEALKQNLRHISITDHDTVAGLEEAQSAAQGRLEVIPGIEINTVLTSQDGGRFDVHVLGYFIDPKHAALETIMRRQQDARNQLVVDTIAKLNGLNIPLSIEVVRQCSGVGSIGRPHLTRAIVMAGGADTVEDAYERFMNRDSKDYIARHSVSPQEAVSAIVESGGIASIAHPGKDKSIESIILQLKNAGLRGVEAYHRSHNLDLVKRYLRFAKHNGMLVTGGSDCHGPYGEHPASIGTLKVPLDVVRALKSACRNAKSVCN